MTELREQHITRGELADILRNEASAIMETQRAMDGPAFGRVDVARRQAVDAAVHQFVFSLLAIVQVLETGKAP